MAAMPLLALLEEHLRSRTSLKWRAYPPDVLPLWVAEMDVATHPAVVDAVTAALERGDTGYPWGTRYANAFAAMAVERWGWQLDVTHQVRRSGDVMNAILALLLGNTAEGDGVLVNPPIYPPFRQVVEGYGRRLVEVHLTGAGRLDLGGIERALAGPGRPAAYLLCSPHNPTGTVHTADELREVATLCARHDVLLVADEIHAVLVDAGAGFVPLLSLPEASGAVVTTSAGKGWNLAGFKAGLFVRGGDAAAVFAALPPLANQSTGHLASIAHTTALLAAQDWVDEVMAEVTANKALLARLVAEHLPGVRYLVAPGTYLAWLDCSALGLTDPASHFLRTARVALNPGVQFGSEYRQFVRLNLATSPEIVTQAVQRMGASLTRQ